MNKNLKILILEDNPTDAVLLHNVLKTSGLNFTSEVVNTREAFETTLDRMIPDIILSDYSLPSFDGVTAFHIKKQKYPHIPFIIFSGILGEDRAVDLIKIGISDYALKDKLFVLPSKIIRAIRDGEEKELKRISDEKIRLQSEQLIEISFLQTHQLRRPVASIMGLISLVNFDDPGDPQNLEVISKLKIATKEFDIIIGMIVEKTSHINS